MFSKINIYDNKDQIIFNKYRPKSECFINGEVSDDNLTLANGKLNLSREGASLLMNELEQYLSK